MAIKSHRQHILPSNFRSIQERPLQSNNINNKTTKEKAYSLLLKHNPIGQLPKRWGKTNKQETPIIVFVWFAKCAVLCKVCSFMQNVQFLEPTTVNGNMPTQLANIPRFNQIHIPPI